MKIENGSKHFNSTIRASKRLLFLKWWTSSFLLKIENINDRYKKNATSTGTKKNDAN